MRKILALTLLVCVCLGCFLSCADAEHERHVDENFDGACDVCDYKDSSASSNVAQVILDYEKKVRQSIAQKMEEKPGYEYFFSPVKQVTCYYYIEGSAKLAEEWVEEWGLSQLFPDARISPLGAIKMIMLTFDRDAFTEQVHSDLVKLDEDEAVIEKLDVRMEGASSSTYMPIISYYAKNAESIAYTEAESFNNLDEENSYIIQSMEDLDRYFAHMLELAEGWQYREDLINAQKEKYAQYDEFFRENVLIVTKCIYRGSGSTKLTVEGLYVSRNQAYVVVKTAPPAGMGTCDAQYKTFAFVVPKAAVEGVTEVTTLE